MDTPKEMQVRMVEYDDENWGVHFEQFIDGEWRELEVIKLPANPKPNPDSSIAFA